VLFSVLVSFWFWRRQPETLALPKRVRFSSGVFLNGFKEILRNKKTMGYTLISGFVVGSFLVYLSSSQQIFQIQFDLKNEFPFIFAGLAIAIGLAIFLNGILVLRFGMEKLVSLSLYAFFGVSILYVILYYGRPNPGVEVLLAFFAVQFFAIGFLFGNLRALAMEPVGHIAGIAAAITGFISTIMAVPISTFIGRYVADTALPLFMGFLVCGLVSVLTLLYLKKTTKNTIPEVSEVP
jgi:DHA1 family bicyclomycin/chloramphenicol resistance-like MFS transporter